MNAAEDILHDLERGAGRATLTAGGAITSHLGVIAVGLLLLAAYIVLRGHSGGAASTSNTTAAPSDYMGQVPVYSTGSFGASPSSTGGSTDLAAALAAQNAQFTAQNESMFGGTPKITIMGGTETWSNSGAGPSMQIGAVYTKDANGNFVLKSSSAPAPSAPVVSAPSAPALVAAPPVATTTGAGAAFKAKPATHWGFYL